MKRFATLFCVFLLYSTLLQADDVNWVDWHTVLPNNDIQGTVIVGDSEVTVTYSGERTFVQLSCGTNYWDPSTPYISADVPNPPPDCDIIALSQATVKTLTFSEPVSNLFFAVVSLNGNGYRFDRDFNILSFGRGYWGDGTLTKEVNPPTYDLIGTGEPHGVIQIVGSFSSVSWTSLSNENWNGFSIAFEDTTANINNDDVSVPAMSPWGLLLMSLALGLLGLIVVRRIN
jgi:fibronectin-binding autotransporter adhesin